MHKNEALKNITLALAVPMQGPSRLHEIKHRDPGYEAGIFPALKNLYKLA